MKKLLSCFLSMIMLFNLVVVHATAEDEISTDSTSGDVDIFPFVKAEANSWLETFEWLKKGICDEMKVLDHFHVYKYVNIAFGDEGTIEPETEMDITFDVIGFLKYLLENEPEELIKNRDDIELVARFVQYGFTYLTDSECVRLEYVLEDIELQIGDIIKSYVKANIVHIISLNRIKKAEEVFRRIANGEVGDSELYEQAAEASRNAVYACLVSASTIDENNKKSLENEELINKYLVDFAVGIVVDLAGYGTAYEVLKISVKAIEIATNDQLTYLNELLDNKSAEDICLQVENSKIKYLNAISNQYLDFAYTIKNDYTLKIVSYNAYGKEFSALKTVDIPEEICLMPITEIDSFMVVDGYVEEVTIPRSVKTFGGSVFYNCPNLKTINYNAIDAEIKTIHTGHIFRECTNIEQINFGDEVQRIPESFMDGSSIEHLVIPETVMKMGQFAFKDCDGLVEVTIPRAVKTFGGSVFYNCPNLKTINYNAIDAEIENLNIGHIFRDCTNIEQINFGDEVQRIPESFMDGSSIEHLVIPETVTKIGEFAFDNCDGLTDIYYRGSETDCASIVIGKHNESLLNAVWHYTHTDPGSCYIKPVTHSVMDTEKGNGLSFRFELLADGVGVVGNKVDYTNATINYYGFDCKLVSMGAVLTNSAAIGSTAFTLDDVNGYDVLDVPTLYLCDVGVDFCAFATRIINIPDSQLERRIYARPYYIIEVDGKQIAVYGDVDTAACAEYM